MEKYYWADGEALLSSWRSTTELMERSTAELMERNTAELTERSTALLMERSTAELMERSTTELMEKYYWANGERYYGANGERYYWANGERYYWASGERYYWANGETHEEFLGTGFAHNLLPHTNQQIAFTWPSYFRIRPEYVERDKTDVYANRLDSKKQTKPKSFLSAFRSLHSMECIHYPVSGPTPCSRCTFTLVESRNVRNV